MIRYLQQPARSSVKPLREGTLIRLKITTTMAGAIAALASFLVTASAQAHPVLDLVNRILPGQADQFICEQIAAPSANENVFEVDSRNGKIVLRGDNTLSQCVALNHYLKYVANVHVSWYADSPIANPSSLPPVPQSIRRTTKIRDRFFLNYCTFGYTMPWWDFRKWERLVDWMALNGVNMPLAQGGTEAIWQKVWKSYGLTDEEIRRDFFTGPSHLPWNRMANIDNLGGPLPQSYIDGQLKLTRRIVERERALGMRPILPAFAGHVPVAIKRIKPDVKLTELAPWPGFNHTTATHFVDPKDPLFSEIQLKFLKEQERTLGSDHLYGTDPFNEMSPPSLEPEYLAGVAKSIFESMTKADPEATWVQMAWTFQNSRNIWSNERVKAMIHAVPEGRMILLDYVIENGPFYAGCAKFFGAPTILNYLGNFGGNTNLVAPLNKVNRTITNAMNDASFPNLSGLGGTLEGLNNQFAYEFILERAWAGAQCDLKEWFRSNANAHSGGKDLAVEEAWEILRTKVLVDNASTIGAHGIVFQSTPRLVSGKELPWSPHPEIRYANADLVAAWGKLLEAGETAKKNPSFRFDLTEVSRQALGNAALDLRSQMLAAYNKRDAAAFKPLSARFMELGRDIDSFLACRPEYLLGTWISDARAWGKDTAEADYYERNARQLISTWGLRGSKLTDYSSRCWNGMLADYYLPRWDMYLKMVADNLDGKVKEPACFNDMEKATRDFEWAWAQSKGPEFTKVPAGDACARSNELYEKYADLLRPER